MKLRSTDVGRSSIHTSGELAPRTLAITLPFSSLERDFCCRRQARKKCPREKTYAQRQRTAITKREKWPRSRRFEEPAFSSWFRNTGWWRMQPSETGLGRPLPCYSLLFEVFQGQGFPAFCCRRLHALGFSLHFANDI